MTGLKTVVLSYSDDGFVSKSTYDGDGFNKIGYHTFLTSLKNNSKYTNCIWKLSIEIYIPSGVILSIPEGVTVLADGGLFFGPGTLAGNYTKIKAGFEQIFTTEVNFKRNNVEKTMYQWDVKEAYPEWFGETVVNKTTEDNGNTNFENLTGNCSLRIQKAIDLIHASTDGYTIGGVTQNLFAGGKVVCKPYSLYNIQTTIYLPLGISFDGGNSNFVYDCISGSYMFKVNTKVDTEEWAISERGQMDVISNIRMINPKQKSNAFGIFSASQCCTFENIQTSNLSQTFKRLGEYLDNVTLRDFSIGSPILTSDNRPQIDMGYIGDNLLVDNVSIFGDTKAIVLRVKGCGGGVIQRITNGTIEIISSQAITLSAVHQEYGNIIIENSLIEINGVYHFKQPDKSAIVVNMRNGSYELRPISLRNISIIYNHRSYTYEKEQLDIELGWITGPIKIENVFRVLKTTSTENSSMYGIKVNNKSFMKNPAANSLSSTLIGSDNGYAYDEAQGCLLNSSISYQIDSYGSIFEDITVHIDGEKDDKSGKIIDKVFRDNQLNFPIGDYIYWASVILDKERNIGFNGEDRKLSVYVSDSSKYVVISLYRFYYIGMTIRLYRKKFDDSFLSYMDIPVCTSHNRFIDLGNTNMFMDKWIQISDTPAKRANITPLECYDYRLMGNNVSVRMPSRPNTSGSGWRKGDTIVLNSGEIINV